VLLFDGCGRVDTLALRCGVLREVGRVVLHLPQVHTGEAAFGAGAVLLKSRQRSLRFDKLRAAEQVLRLLLLQTFDGLRRGIPGMFPALRVRAESHPGDVVGGGAAQVANCQLLLVALGCVACGAIGMHPIVKIV